ncbi:MAG TPA: serine/threonine-protein kinase [bacterium]|nr:serine/threonine-protein kinase [bacterium]
MPTLGRYTLLRRVATGGMAEIWKAKVQGPAGFSKTVAIKKVLPHLVEDSDFIDMFIEEAKLVAELVHPNIVQVFDFGELGPREYFLAMEYVAGANVGRLIKRVQDKGGKIPAGVSLYMIAEAARGLGAAHAKTDPEGNPLNIVHRDVSPQNILVSFGGEVKVSDFGIAKAASASSRTAEGMVRGKLAYMSPEQANGKTLDGRSDLFALGIVLWELLTGKRLFSAGSSPEIYGKVSKFQGLTPEEVAAIPPGLAPVVLPALQPDPNQRYANALQMEQALTAVLGSDGVLRARSMLSSMMQSLFTEERRMEATPTEAVAVGTGGVIGATTPSDPNIAETVASPTTPAAISALTLGGSKVEVIKPVGDVAKPAEAAPAAPAPEPARPRTALYAAIGVAGVMTIVVAILGTKMLTGGSTAKPTATPVVTQLAMGSPTVAASATPAASAAASATATTVATPASTPATHPATPTPTRIAIATPPVTAVVPTSTPHEVAHGAGNISVKARPWVSVWMDGKLVTKETPLRDFRVGAGAHTFRFINDALHYDAAKTISVPANGAIVVSVDVAKNTISVQ